MSFDMSNERQPYFHQYERFQNRNGKSPEFPKVEKTKSEWRQDVVHPYFLKRLGKDFSALPSSGM